MSYISFYDDGELRAYLFEQGLNLLQANLFMLLQSIDKYAEQSGNYSGIKASNAKIGRELGITQRAVTNNLSKLQELGLIQVTFDRSIPSNTKRIIKPIKLAQYSLESQISGLIGYINKFLNSIPDNWEELEKDNPETRNQIKKAISYFGSDKEVMNYINSNRDEFTNYDTVIDWLSNFSTP